MPTTGLRRARPPTVSPSTTSRCPCSNGAPRAGRPTGPSNSRSGSNMPRETDRTWSLYRRALMALRDSGIPFMVGGAYGLGYHTQIHRETKDLDLFTLPRCCPDMLRLFADLGFPSRMVARHWLGKVMVEDAVIDIITGFRNGVGQVEQNWLDHAPESLLFSTPVRILAPEEMIWSKAFVMERDRYDGADIVHLIRARAGDLDWRRLLARFGAHWLLLL